MHFTPGSCAGLAAQTEKVGLPEADCNSIIDTISAISVKQSRQSAADLCNLPSGRLARSGHFTLLAPSDTSVISLQLRKL